MTGPRVDPWSGIKLVEVVAVDGRTVCLHEQWYHVHILQRKPEIGSWLMEPLEEIKTALREAVEVRFQPENKHYLYVGPFIGKGFCGDYRLHVAVAPQPDDRGVVFTVMMKR